MFCSMTMTRALSSPLSFYSIPAIWLLAYIPGFAKVSKRANKIYVVLMICAVSSPLPLVVSLHSTSTRRFVRAMMLFTNLDVSVAPRQNLVRLGRKDIKPELLAKLKRMEGAHTVSSLLVLFPILLTSVYGRTRTSLFGQQRSS